MMFAFAGFSFAQDGKKPVHVKTTVVKPKPAATLEVKTPPAKVKVKKDGTPDKRYKANKMLKKDGTPDKRYKANKKS